MKRLCLYTLTAILVAGSLGLGCSKKEQKVRVATDATWPPFEFVNERTKSVDGFSIEVMSAVAKMAGIDIEYSNVAFDPLLAGIAKCQFDAAVSSLTITEDRKKSMSFSEPYFSAGQIVTVRADNANITDKDGLAGKTAGAQIGTTGAIEINRVPGATLKTYDDVGLAFQDLINGQIDAVVADNPVALGYIGKNTNKLKTAGDVFTKEFYGIAVCNKNSDLLKKINKGLALVKADGTLGKLAEKWLNVKN